MRFIRELITSLILPNNAGANDPRVVIGADLPPEVITYYASHSETAIRGTVYYRDATHYVYAILVFTPFGSQGVYAIGGRDGGAVTEDMRYSPTTISVGANSDPTLFVVENGADLLITTPSDFLIDNVPQPHGILWEVSSVTATGALAAETTVLTAPSATYKNNRAYRVEWHWVSNQTIAGVVNVKFRRTNLAGANKVSWASPHASTGSTTDQEWEVIVNASGADITDTAVLTAAPGAGTVTVQGTTATVQRMICWDCGAAGQFTNAIQF